MEKIVLEKSPLADVTLISNLFLDKYMPRANGEYVKVYLYILRCSTMSDAILSVDSIASSLELTEADVTRALKYWDQTGILGIEFNNRGALSRIIIKDLRNDMPITFKLVPEVTATSTIASSTSSPFKVDKQPVIAKSVSSFDEATEKNVPKQRQFTTSELSTLTSDEDIKELLYISQTYLGKTLSSTETNTILYFYDGLKFPIDLIEYLIEYCVSNGHTAMKYIETVALSWAKENITSVDMAKARMASVKGNSYPIMKAFGLSGRNLATSEQEFVIKWTDEYGFPLDMILDACNRTINTIHQPSFQYADSILQRWLKNGIKTLADVKTLDNIHETKVKEPATKSQMQGNYDYTNKPSGKNSFNSFKTQREYDYTALERDLLRRR
ncbi:MAG: DnaD domain protein [Lachnospiraceae bacterium]|jgi:DnaD/phage-associated family protein|nr:DnaD domain protein [Lachnospiraceae bacterium]